ncbi:MULTISPECIES: hypothetical protein [Sphingobium]|jgi:hypothetical protein|uniref:Uncharacterized protein n=1 Tax=Sphingobium fuliginis (strain ATCC 27551) TaxID=336203 RepID=A0A292ZGV9_SPHSA|nr:MULTISPECIES: hypothetical protein [Sphingobium]OAP32681.1 hypothetical protein A8O16_07275 [Sphingobium sp. 20006FA]KXU31593.1 hypothetical protein AXW74_12095 [Sphingobium sp. AM]KYC33499.1 hypothetical protein A0J57_05155 [Sphingobium sp. 22B]QOT70390.1 hypothetical protein H5V43_09450 [Sphingobium fuliginis]GAY22055.1 hypothetical protein SFOMI_2609 [Sphingobium fuliginis]
MIYKAFAAVTLIAAPIIVLTVESFVPQSSQAVPSAAIVPASAPVVMPAQAAPSPTPPQDSGAQDPGAADLGQPMPEAGRPFLAPGAGLPAAPVSNPTPVEGVQPSDEVPE